MQPLDSGGPVQKMPDTKRSGVRHWSARTDESSTAKDAELCKREVAASRHFRIDAARDWYDIAQIVGCQASIQKRLADGSTLKTADSCRSFRSETVKRRVAKRFPAAAPLLAGIESNRVDMRQIAFQLRSNLPNGFDRFRWWSLAGGGAFRPYFAVRCAGGEPCADFLNVPQHFS